MAGTGIKLIENRGDHLFVEYSGPLTPAELMTLMHEVARVCQEQNCTKILADLRQGEGEVKIIDRFELGVIAADIFRGMDQVAIVFRPDETNLFAETVAVNRGLPSKITHDMDEARRWLGID
jgi:hypothetical protein